MRSEDDITIHISPQRGEIIVESTENGVHHRKEINETALVGCLTPNITMTRPGLHSGFLPLNTLAVTLGEHERSFLLWYPKLYANVSVYDTSYEHFPIPRLVFGFTMDESGKILSSRIGVVANEAPAPETVMFHYPFSNVSESSGSLCVGSNKMPIYKKPHKAVNLPAFLLSIPNNFHSYYTAHNRLGLEYRELMEHLKDKEPSYYYSDILIPNGKTLQDFINH